MIRTWSQKFQADIITIYPGEFFAGSEYILHTVLGTCIAVVLMPEQGGSGGMNHFMLPGGVERLSLYDDQAGRYGVTAMELLINELMKQGIERKKLRAKVFGGGHVILFPREKGENTIGQQNIDFVFRFLEAEKIPILSHDVGGFGGRRVYFFPKEGKVLVSRLKKPEAEEEIRLEEEYYRRIVKKESKPIRLFDS